MLDSRTVPVVASADLEADIHGTFARYRPSCPFIALDTGGYVVLRHDDVRRLLDDPRLQATETAMPAQAGISQGELYDIFALGMLTANGAVHARRRSALSRTLANQLIEQFRRHFRQAAFALLDECYDNGRLELASGYAARLPILALAGLLDIPGGDVPSFMRDVYEMNEFFRPHATADSVASAESATNRLRLYLDRLLVEAETGPAPGFLRDYLRNVEQDGLSRGEALMQIIQLIIGGTESVRTALVSQAVNLRAHGEQWQAVCDDPALVPDAVAEGLRFEPGIAGVVRVSAADIEIDGWTLPAGQLVILSFISALRDERIFARADSFDISRSNLNMSRLAFGGGAHRCVADALGRAELEEGLSVLVERLPTLQLDAPSAFHGHVFVRSTSQCWVTWQP
tara:strand:+ start:2235 stop:3434 length:1200 start_codon:yes stop_codon:yes gene_type:complete